MKWHPKAHFSILILAFAILSPSVMAQLAPAAALPSADTAAVPSTRPLRPSPILDYSPPTEKEKLKLFAFNAVGPYALAEAALEGGYQQATKSPPEWKDGATGFETRVASNFDIQLVTTATRYAMAEVLREDTAYYRCECPGFFHRLGHALISTVTARYGNDGHTAFSLSGLVSPYAGTMTALAWYPERYGVKDGFRMGNYNLAGQAVGNLALEFLYAGPHALFSHLRGAKSQSVPAVAATP